MSNNESPAVLISGAGITGLVLALSLIKNGVSVRIIDKQQRTIGRRGLGLHGRSLETHKLLGLLPDVLERSGQIPVTQLYSPADPYSVVKTLPFFEPYETTSSKLHINTVCFSQDKHEELVREHLQKLGCIVEAGKELTAFEQQEDHVVAHVKSASGEIEIIKPHWLVGADGAHSVVRKSSGLTFLGELAPSDVCVIADATLKCNLDKNFTHMWGDPTSKGFMFFPHEDKALDLWTVICVGTQLNHEFVAASIDNMAKEFSDATGRTDIKFVSSSWLVKYRPQMRMVNSFRAGRVLVAGDAAHIHSATGGQGLNSGIQDAVNLGWKLALVAKHQASASLLDSYNDERLPVIATMLRLTTALLDATIHPEEPGDLRGLTREFALRQFGVNYRKSPIIVDESVKDDAEMYDPYRSGDNGEVRAGDRAPDGELEAKGKTVYDLFGATYHTVLVFAPDLGKAKGVLEFLRGLDGGLFKPVVALPRSAKEKENGEDVVKDAEGHVYENYRVKEGEVVVVVVRPDSWIGARVGGVVGIEQYVQGLSIHA